MSRSRVLMGLGLVPYSIGEPTDEEQLYLERINQARRDPVAESARLQASEDPDLLVNLRGYAVDFDLMTAQFSALAPAPPLSMSAPLMAAARLHSQDMLAHAFQDHPGTDGSTPLSRVQDQGYVWSAIGENVFAAAQSVEHGHAAFEVDWGVADAVGGMQNPPGHRLNIHGTGYREVGIGVVAGVNGGVGPQVVTQDFASRQGLTPFITGVVYYDLNGNGRYDLGEGVDGVTVGAPGVAFYAVTAASGGYSLPVPANDAYTVTFSALNMANRGVLVPVANDNVKLDQALAYTPPPVTGPEAPLVDQPNAFACAPVAAATRYLWTVERVDSASVVEGAESGLGRFTALVTPGYAVVDSSVRASGQSAFHLAHPRSGGPEGSPQDQFLILQGTYLARADTALIFTSRLGWAASTEVARVQISLDRGINWQDVWAQAGTDNAGETAFAAHTVPLEGFAGRTFLVRFAYDFLAGGFYPQTEPGVGFYIDDVRLVNADELTAISASETTDASFGFVPSAEGRYAITVRPVAGARILPVGPAKVVSAQVGTGTALRLNTIRILTGRMAEIRFSVVNPGATSFHVYAAESPGGPWTAEEGATIQSLGAVGFAAVLSVGSESQRYYRVQTAP